MKKNLKVLQIDVSLKEIKRFEHKIGDFYGPIDVGKYYSEKNNSLNIGTGLFADSPLSGSNRLTFTGASPCWEGFYISTMGGAGLIFEELDISLLSLVGKAKKPSILYLNNKNNEIEVKIEEINIEEVWGKENKENDTGVYNLMTHIYKLYKDEFIKNPRILAIGKSSKLTDFGAICSAPIKKSEVTHVDTWAGRGGFGSKMFQDHHIVGIIYGGGEIKKDKLKKVEVNKWFKEKYEMSFIQKDKNVTMKYNYVDILKTGGTLGVNYSSLGRDLLSFNYTSIYKDEKERFNLNEEFISNHYLKQFKEENLDKKNSKTCGEPCIAMCKKMNGKYKKDYEPYQTMGPLIGIFDQRAAEIVNRHSDSYGFDAISIGGVISWLMECIYKGYLSKEDLDLKENPIFNEKDFNIISSSNHNAKIAINILDNIIEKKGILDLSQGVRVLAKELSENYNKNIINLCSYNSNGKKGWMIPNQYWTPGVFSPMALMGKYYMYYGNDFIPPQILGRKNAERFVAELMIDNISICRFHRGWAEDMTPIIIGKIYNLEKEFITSNKKLAKEINKNGKPIFWETERNVDIISSFIEKQKNIKYSQELKYWKEYFRKNKKLAAKSFWEEMYIGTTEYFNEIE